MECGSWRLGPVRTSIPRCPSYPTSALLGAPDGARRRPAARGGAHRQPVPRAHDSTRAVAALAGRTVRGIRRLGKRIVFELDGELFIVVHLMIAGRLRWRERGAADPRQGRAGRVRLSRPARCSAPRPARSARRRCTSSRGEAALAALDPGGLEVLDADLPAVRRAAHARQPHAQAGADRSAHLQRHRQRLLRRDPARGAALADEADRVADRRRDRAAVRGDARDAAARGSSGCATRRRAASRRRSPRSAPEWPSTAATASPARSAARRSSASSTRDNEANYCAPLPDRRPAAVRSRAVAPAQADWPKRSKKWRRAEARLSRSGRRSRLPGYGRPRAASTAGSDSTASARSAPGCSSPCSALLTRLTPLALSLGDGRRRRGDGAAQLLLARTVDLARSPGGVAAGSLSAAGHGSSSRTA